ncbi:MAG: hypothetical protein M1817_000162 [Caeruleum heppii]|nr:MAG: hypothetical protein M1817_000162 [Caeruleum heppii]
MADQAAHAGMNFTPTIHNDTYPAIEPTKLDLSGKTVFITGASKGIGRATALSYAKAGASAIAIAARSDLSSLEDEIRTACKDASRPSAKILKLALDVLDSPSIITAAEEVCKTLGGLDILVNNAGYLENFKPIGDTDPEEWWYTWQLNMRGPYLVTKAVLPMLLKAKAGGQVVNLTSVGAHFTLPGGSAYQTSKFAVIRFSEFLQAEYGEKGLLAYSVHPGGVPTEMGRRMPEYMHHVLTDTPELAGDSIVFLTQEKRDWLGGRYVSCTWDMPEFLARKEDIVEGNKLLMRMVV